MSDLATLLDPARSAHASIHGYLYQAYLGVERLLDLEKDVVLRFEGDEDLDLLFRDGSGGLSEQVKVRTGSVNLRDEVVQDTLRRFAISHHRLRATGDDRTFLFTHRHPPDPTPRRPLSGGCPGAVGGGQGG